MSGQRVKKAWIAVIVAMVMVFSVLPAMVFAGGDVTDDIVAGQASNDGIAGDTVADQARNDSPARNDEGAAGLVVAVWIILCAISKRRESEMRKKSAEIAASMMTTRGRSGRSGVPAGSFLRSYWVLSGSYSSC